MKKILKTVSMAACMILILQMRAISQDVDINILMTPGTIAVGQTGQIQIDICNQDGGSTVVPSYKLRPLISVPAANLLITGVTDLPAGWSICSQTASSIRFSNGTDNMPAGTCQTFYVNVQGIAVTNPSGVIGSTMSFGGGTAATACNAGPMTPGNDPANDNSTSGFIVSTTLPVQLMSFYAVSANCSTVLKWQTASEVNTEKFVVEYSSDGRHFDPAMTIPASGNSNATIKYEAPFTPVQSTGFFRLKMLDMDGTGTYSSVLKVENPCAGADKYSLYPNPADDQFTLQMPDGKLRILLISDATGRQLLKQSLMTATAQTISIKGWSKGLYAVQVVENGQIVYSSKLVKL